MSGTPSQSEAEKKAVLAAADETDYQNLRNIALQYYQIGQMTALIEEVIAKNHLKTLEFLIGSFTAPESSFRLLSFAVEKGSEESVCLLIKFYGILCRHWDAADFQGLLNNSANRGQVGIMQALIDYAINYGIQPRESDFIQIPAGKNREGILSLLNEAIKKENLKEAERNFWEKSRTEGTYPLVDPRGWLKVWGRDCFRSTYENREQEGFASLEDEICKFDSLADPECNFLLGWAAENNMMRAVKHLLSLGVSVDTPYAKYDCTPLMIAIIKGHEPVVMALLAAGANINATYKYGHPCSNILTMAVGSNNINILALVMYSSNAAVRNPSSLGAWYLEKMKIIQPAIDAVNNLQNASIDLSKESKQIALLLAKLEISKTKTLVELSALEAKYLPLFSRNRSRFSALTKHIPSSLPVFLQDIQHRREELTHPSAPPLAAVDVTASSDKSPGLYDLGAGGAGSSDEAPSAPPLDDAKPSNDRASIDSESSEDSGFTNNNSAHEISSDGSGSIDSSVTASTDIHRRPELSLVLAVSAVALTEPAEEVSIPRTAGCLSFFSALVPNVQEAQNAVENQAASLWDSLKKLKKLVDLDALQKD